MFSARFLALLIALTVFFPNGIHAIETGDCAGLVLDENGVPVGAAQTQFQYTVSQVYRIETDSSGRFVLRNLPTGDYQLEVRKAGFFLLTGRSFTLHAGPNEITLTLYHEQEIREQIHVDAPLNQVDTQDTSQRSTLTARNISDIPVPNSHVLTESLVALPEIVRDHLNNLHVAGARSGDTQYLLDGFEIGDPVGGTLTARFNVDATRAAEVQTGRFGAGYAHPGAAVLSLETPDGDDRWRFGVTNPLPGIDFQEGPHLGNWYPRFTFSGPLEQGRFWFSDSISVQHTFDVVKQQPSGANTTEQWAGDNLLHLQYNLTPRHILHASFLYNRADDSNLGLDALNPQSTTVSVERRRSFVSLKDQLWLHEIVFELGIAADSGVLDEMPQGTQPFVLLINGSSGNYFQRLHQRGRRLQAFGNVIVASRHWHGAHQLAFGLNVAGLRSSQSAQRTEIQAFRANGTLVRQSTFAGPANPRLSNTQAGAYAQDTWSISKHLVFQAGLRTDWDHFTQRAMAEPRASVNFLPWADKLAKFALGWGIYNAPLNLTLIGQALDQRQLDSFYDPTGAVVVLGPVTSQFVLPSGGIHQPRFMISSAGWQQKLTRNTLASIELLARNGDHGFAFVDLQPSQPGGTFLLQDQRKDRYRAATVSARHVFSESTEVFAAYTRSVANSNQLLDPALGSIFYAPQQSGPVAWDAPNRLLIWGLNPTHIWATQLSYFLEYRTGYPFSVINLQQQLVGAPNSSRFPAYVSLNLGIEKKFEFRGYFWSVRLRVVNIFGRQNPDTVVNNIDAPNFRAFAGGQGRALSLRVRFAGRK